VVGDLVQDDPPDLDAEPRRIPAVEPFERAARSMLKANSAFSDSALRRADKSNRRRRDGWILDAPVIVLKSGRDSYNRARKAVPFGIMPKA